MSVAAIYNLSSFASQHEGDPYDRARAMAAAQINKLPLLELMRLNEGRRPNQAALFPVGGMFLPKGKGNLVANPIPNALEAGDKVRVGVELKLKHKSVTKTFPPGQLATVVGQPRKERVTINHKGYVGSIGFGDLTLVAARGEPLSIATPAKPKQKMLLPTDDNETQILHHVGHKPIHIDEIIRRSGLQPSIVSGYLPMMELRGMVRQVGGMNFVRSQKSTPTMPTPKPVRSVSSADIKKACAGLAVQSSAISLLEAGAKLGWSLSQIKDAVRIANTIRILAKEKLIDVSHMAEACQYVGYGGLDAAITEWIKSDDPNERTLVPRARSIKVMASKPAAAPKPKPTETKPPPEPRLRRVVVKSNDRLSNTTYHKRCRSRGQQRWWLRDSKGNFVQIPSARGDDYFEAELDLALGKYVLGTGPADRFGIRETITVRKLER